MESKFIFTTSAFKHGISKEDIIHAYKNISHKGVFDEFTGKHGIVGFSRAGNAIEVFYNPIGDDTIKVFHAMRYRKGTINFLQ